MKEVICYKLEDGSLFENKEAALVAEQELNNRKVIDHIQTVPLKFEVGDIVYIACRDKIRQCRVNIITQETELYYHEDTSEKYTSVEIKDINEPEVFSYATHAYNRDLNTLITTKFTDLCNFDYEKYL